MKSTTLEAAAVSPRYAWVFRSEGNIETFFSARARQLFGELDLVAEHNLLRHLPPAELFKDMARSVARIADAMESGEHITIFGDYDVDGTTSCAMLKRFFDALGYPVSVYIPERLVEGYGLNPIGLEKIATQYGRSLVVTVDNGIAAVAACDKAKALGLDVIVTDHHEIPAELPRAFAILNPKQHDCAFPYKMLAGVGVAFYLMIALRKALREKGHPRAETINLRSYLDLVAIGTIADVAPLDGVNHILCKTGLAVFTEHIANDRRPGLAHLLRLAGWSGEEAVASTDVGFKIGPRLNAAGRLGTALATEELLSTDDEARARELAELLHGENAERQAIEKQIKEQAFAQIAELGHIPEAIVLYNPEWHTGVVGIVASRVLEKFYRPTLVLGSLDGKMKGSGRSTHAFDLFSSLTKVREEFVSFGGHFHAVGLTTSPEKLPWLREYLAKEVRETLAPHEYHRPLFIDGQVPLATLGGELFDKLACFEPYGTENPRPRFLIRNARIRELKRIGKNPEAGHVSFCIDDGSAQTWVTGFGCADDIEQAAKSKNPLDLVIEGKNEVWRSKKRAKVQLIDFLQK